MASKPRSGPLATTQPVAVLVVLVAFWVLVEVVSIRQVWKVPAATEMVSTATNFHTWVSVLFVIVGGEVGMPAAAAPEKLGVAVV